MIKGTFIDAFQECQMKRICEKCSPEKNDVCFLCSMLYYAEILWHLIVKTEIPYHKSIFSLS